MDITKEMLMTSSHASRRVPNYKGILTTEEAIEYLKQHKEIITISNLRERTFFFADDHCFGVHVLPDNWTPCSSRMPQGVYKRSATDVVNIVTIQTVAEYVERFHHDEKQITSVEELLLYLNK